MTDERPRPLAILLTLSAIGRAIWGISDKFVILVHLLFRDYLGIVG